mmetsp:Transcript_14477/g.21710  ORF Transcript_14477/g.21710 Transcript_14477/m.21710 type:complete len:240 (-) Transcript_14477:34-753(-)
MGNNSLESRNRSRNLLLGKESDDSKHSSTSVVDLLNESICLGLFGTVGGPSKRIVEVKSSSRDVLSIESGHFSDLSSLHVMLLTAYLTPVFKESNEGKDLQLSRVRDSIHSLRSRINLRERSSIQHHWPRPGDSVSMNNVTNESKHGNTSVLNLRLSKESNGRFLGSSPEVGGRKSKRIEAGDNGVELLCKDREVIKGLHLEGRGGSNSVGECSSVEGGGGECSSSGCEDGGDSELHVG